MKLISNLLIVLFWSRSLALAASLPTPNFDMSIYVLNAESTQVSSLKGGMRLGVMAQGEIDENSSYFGKMNIFFEEGSHSSLNNESYSKASTFGIEEAYYQYKPLFWLKLRAGITKLDNQYSPLFIYSPSLGLQEEIKVIDFDTFELKINANQKVISSNSTVSRTGKLTEKSAQYYLNGLELHWHSTDNFLKLRYDHFIINDLNSTIADKARFIGNTVTGLTESTKFVNEYNGHSLSAAVGFNSLTFYAHYMQNTKNNDIGLLEGVKYKVNENYEFSAENYKIEGDTTLATLVSPYYGATNRKGQHYRVSKFFGANQIDLNFVDSKAVKASLYQDDLYIIIASFTHQF